MASGDVLGCDKSSTAHYPPESFRYAYKMPSYQRVTIETLERRGQTEWRVIGWTSDGKPLTIAYCPNEEMARQLKQTLLEGAGMDAPGCTSP